MRSSIDYLVTDAMSSELWPGRFHCVASLAMLHHVSLRPALLRLRDAVAPDGVLLILDLDDSSGFANLPRNGLAWVERAVHRRAWTTPKDLATAWAEHGRDEEYPRFSDVRTLCAELLPGARMTRHLSWRYSIVWRRP